MSPIFRISRLETFSLKRVIVILNSSKCEPKTGLPQICVGDVFYMRGGTLRKKHSRGTRSDNGGGQDQVATEGKTGDNGSRASNDGERVE